MEGWCTDRYIPSVIKNMEKILYFDNGKIKENTNYNNSKILMNGSVYFNPEELTTEDVVWLSLDYDAIRFSDEDEYIEELHAIIVDKRYRAKLSPKALIGLIEDDDDKCDYDDDECDGELADPVPDMLFDTEYKEYERLGDILTDKNADQAYLCYENAAFLCPIEAERQRIAEKIAVLKAKHTVRVKEVSFIILSHNEKYMTQKCLESIWNRCAKGSYEIVIVDNASTDGSAEWLQKCRYPINLFLSDKNSGFAGGCNKGISLAKQENDVFCLNNDTRLSHNSLFWLRMALYEHKNIGMTGAVSNYGRPEIRHECSFASPDDYVAYGNSINVISERAFEEKSFVSGFAMLMKREALERAGVFDEAFNPGYFEDDDICIRFRKSGYTIGIVHNSFIYHAGSQSFIKNKEVEALIESHYYLYLKKWGLAKEKMGITKEELEILKKIKSENSKDAAIRILEMNCGTGDFLARLSHEFPKAEVVGVERDKVAIDNALSSATVLSYEDFEENPENFDYIIRR